jgi:hypothetical protein
MPLLLSLALLLLSAPVAALADDTPPPPDPALVQRADKIVTALKLEEVTQSGRVRDLIARYYADLRLIHSQRDTGLEIARATPDKAEAATRESRARNDAAARQAALHYAFVATLSAELTAAQIDGVKDGLTYGVLPNTYKVYQNMLPNLTTEQKRQILAWLTEAREHAMDASTSDEKHAWFGKYKGRINNYLAKAGIDMKQAEKEMMLRKKTGSK